MLLSRCQFAYFIIYEVNATKVVTRATFGMPANPQPAAFVSWLTQWLGVSTLSATTNKALLDYIGPGAITSATLREKTLGVLYLLACSPEYQVI